MPQITSLVSILIPTSTLSLPGYMIALSLCFNDLRVDQRREPYIGLTQENLIEISVQDCLPYILKPNRLCTTTLAYSK